MKVLYFLDAANYRERLPCYVSWLVAVILLESTYQCVSMESDPIDSLSIPGYVALSPSVRFHALELDNMLIEFRVHNVKMEVAQPVADVGGYARVRLI